MVIFGTDTVQTLHAGTNADDKDIAGEFAGIVCRTACHHALIERALEAEESCQVHLAVQVAQIWLPGALLNKGDFTKVGFKNGIMTKVTGLGNLSERERRTPIYRPTVL